MKLKCSMTFLLFFHTELHACTGWQAVCEVVYSFPQLFHTRLHICATIPLTCSISHDVFASNSGACYTECVATLVFAVCFETV